MTRSRLLLACATMIQAIIIKYCSVSIRRCEDISDVYDGARHCIWMLRQIPVFYDKGRNEKATRWLGFVQGWCVTNKVYKISDLKVLNAPEGADIDNERI